MTQQTAIALISPQPAPRGLFFVPFCNFQNFQKILKVATKSIIFVKKLFKQMNMNQHDGTWDEQPEDLDTPAPTPEVPTGDTTTTTNDPLEELFYHEDDEDLDEDLDEQPEDLDAPAPTPEAAPKTESVPSDFVEDVIFMLDDIKAQLCQAIAQDQTPDKYRNSTAKRKAFAAQTSRFLDSKEFKITPTQAYLLAVIMFVTPSIAGALYTRNKKARQRPEPTPTPATPEATAPEAAPHEITSKRTRFEVHASTGAYKYDPTGTYIEVGAAAEKPSPQVKKLIERGFSATEIKKYLGTN